MSGTRAMSRKPPGRKTERSFMSLAATTRIRVIVASRPWPTMIMSMRYTTTCRRQTIVPGRKVRKSFRGKGVIQMPKICPIRSTDPIVDDIPCIEDKCAWWHAGEKACCIRSLHYKLNDLIVAVQNTTINY